MIRGREIARSTTTATDALGQDPVSTSATCAYPCAGLQLDLNDAAVAASAAGSTASSSGKVVLSANRHAAAAANRLSQDGVCIEARCCDRAADQNASRSPLSEPGKPSRWAGLSQSS